MTRRFRGEPPQKMKVANEVDEPAGCEGRCGPDSKILTVSSSLISSPSPTTFGLSHLHLQVSSSLISSPSPTTFELSHLHLQVSSSLISSPSPTQTSRSLFSDDANHGLEDSLTRALSLSSSISGSLHLSCLSLCLCLESSGMMFDGFCSLSQSIVSLCLIVNPSHVLFSRSLFSDDANHGLEDSLTRALSLSSSISGSLHLSCLSLCLCLESSGMMFDGFCSLSQSIVWVLFMSGFVSSSYTKLMSLLGFARSQARKLTLSMAIDSQQPPCHATPRLLLSSISQVRLISGGQTAIASLHGRV
ncbi:hypothetical protein F2Q69_00059033 [Brassica cretica]|uniref:Uncharacterized protein n=1 Tax=Brassica cretica TaxID=69181 RepID=A0A8S9RL57_BRACR|nr:hypothetical protein F2Q69_00059033 [Brassica cretica]